MKLFKTSAPAKIILFGEHAVVYSHPAIAIPVSDVRTYAELQLNDTQDAATIRAENLDIEFSLADENPPDDVKHLHHAIHQVAKDAKLHLPPHGWKMTLSSQIPIARGMGSSAAMNVALIRILFTLCATELDNVTLTILAYELEKYHHGKPSGIDHTVVIVEKPLYFQKNKPNKILKPATFHFAIGDTGVGKKTGDVVNQVAKRYSEDEQTYRNIFRDIGTIAEQGALVLEKGNDDKLGELMNENQALLRRIAVSSPELEKLIAVANNNGAKGAKLCGAGQGGCIIALADNLEHAQYIANNLLAGGAQNSFVTSLNK